MEALARHGVHSNGSNERRSERSYSVVRVGADEEVKLAPPGRTDHRPWLWLAREAMAEGIEIKARSDFGLRENLLFRC